MTVQAKKSWTYTDFWTSFLRAESRSKALSVRVLGMQVWPLLRTKIYYRIAQQVGLFDAPHPHAEAATQAAQPLADLAAVPRARVVVVPFSRSVGASDPYSDRVIDALQLNRVSHWVLRHHEPAAAIDIHHLRASFDGWYEPMVSRAMRRLAKRRAAEGWQRIVQALEAEFGVELDKYREYPKWLFRRHLIEAYGFFRVFRAAGAKRLYLVNAYSHPSIVLGAKLARVKVFELQHGFISEFHPAYSYPANTRSGGRLRRAVQTAPHRLLVWGDYWTRAASLPRNTRALVSGPTVPFDEARKRVLAQRAEASRPADLPRRVTFTSQGALAGPLFAAAQHYARALPEVEFVYRLHPNEALADYAAWHQGSPANLTLSHRDPIFLDLLAETDLLVGGFSTTLYEGLAFGLPVIALRLPGFENLGEAVACGDIQLLDPRTDAVAIREAFERARPATNPTRYYAELADPRRFPGV